MKIDGTSLSPVGSVQATNRVGQVKGKALSQGADEVAVSEKAQVYQALLQKVKEIPDVREERVRTLAEQIANGEFQVNAQKVAEKLLAQDI